MYFPLTEQIMSKKEIVVRYDHLNNVVKLPTKINSFIIPYFAQAINLWKSKRRFWPLFIDFSAVAYPYANGMLPLISMISRLKLEGYDIRIRLPNDKKIRDLFIKTNWAYYLDHELEKSKSNNDRHLHTRQFRDYKDVAIVTNDFMDVVL